MAGGRVPLVASGYQKFDGRWLKAGDPFETTEADAADMVAMGLATRAPANKRADAEHKPAEAQAQMETRSMSAEERPESADPEDKTTDVEAARKKRAYRRRDMVAERP